MKRLIRHILLAALLLHTLIPAGWMPGPAGLGASAFIICTADGVIEHGNAPHDPAGHQNDACPFATAAHATDTPAVAALAAPLAGDVRIASAVLPLAAFLSARFSPQSPRAPPLFA